MLIEKNRVQDLPKSGVIDCYVRPRLMLQDDQPSAERDCLSEAETGFLDIVFIIKKCDLRKNIYHYSVES